MPNIELPAILKVFNIIPNRKESKLIENYRYWFSSIGSSRVQKNFTVVFTSIGISGNINSNDATNALTIEVTYSYRNISIIANGKQIQSEKEPFIYEGRVFAPIRTIGEAMNKDVEWNNAKNQVLITDKPLEEPQKFLSFPLHKIGERVVAYPYAITIEKVYHSTKERDDLRFKDILSIDVILEVLL